VANPEALFAVEAGVVDSAGSQLPRPFALVSNAMTGSIRLTRVSWKRRWSSGSRATSTSTRLADSNSGRLAHDAFATWTSLTTSFGTVG
jgi:hypothetical protein